MTDKDVVYVVTIGEYDTHEVLFVCPSKELADEAVSELSEDPIYSDARIEEIQAVDKPLSKVTVYRRSAVVFGDGVVNERDLKEEVWWSFRIEDKDNVEVASDTSEREFPRGFEDKEVKSRLSTRGTFTRRVRVHEKGIFWCVWGTDKEKVEKAYREGLSKAVEERVSDR